MDSDIDYEDEIQNLKGMAENLSIRWNKSDSRLNYLPLIIGLLNEANYLSIWTNIHRYSVKNFDDVRSMMLSWTRRQMLELGFPNSLLEFVS